MKYLIIKCEEWRDNVDRTPMYITDDWKSNCPEYDFEVWEVLDNGTIGEIVKYYDVPMEKGMIFGYYDNEEEFHTIEKFPNKTRNDKCLSDIYDKLISINEMCDDLEGSGYISAYNSKEDREYIYGEYADSHMPQSY